MSSNITVQTANGEKLLFDTNSTILIDINKGDNVFVPELASSLKLEILGNNLKITFDNGNVVELQDIIKLIADNNININNGLFDKVDITVIAFMNEDGNYVEVDFFEKLLELIDASAAGNVDEVLRLLNDKATPVNDSTIIEDEGENRLRSDFNRSVLIEDEERFLKESLEENSEGERVRGEKEKNFVEDEKSSYVGNLNFFASSVVSEDGGQITYSISLDTKALSAMTISLSNGSTITIPAGGTFGKTTVIVSHDDVYNDSETIGVSISNVLGGGFDSLEILNNSVSTQIVDDIDTTIINLEVSPTLITEDDTKITYTAKVTNPPQTDLIVKLSNGKEIVIKAGEIEASVDMDIEANSDIYVEVNLDGKGKTDIDTQSYVAELSYNHAMNSSLLIRPYIALRYALVKQDGYTETEVDNPLTYNTIRHCSKSALVGVKVKKQLTDKVVARGSMGLEHDLSHKTDNLEASGVSGLTSESFSNNLDKTRPVASLGADYYIDQTQRLSVNAFYQELPFASTKSRTLYINYM